MDHHKSEEPNREYPSGVADGAEVERGYLRGILEVGDSGRKKMVPPEIMTKAA